MKELIKKAVLFLNKQRGDSKDIDFLLKIPLPLHEGVDRFKELLVKEFETPVEEFKDFNNNMWVLKIDRGVRIDFLVSMLKWQDELVKTAVTEEVFGINVPVATPESLIVLKLKAWGIQDRVDIIQLYPFADKDLLSELAKRARVDKKLKKLLKELANEI